MSYLKANDKYFEKFGDHFPDMCFQTASDDELVKMVYECIEKNTKAEELYNISYTDNIVY